jgi:hypothetical protein
MRFVLSRVDQLRANHAGELGRKLLRHQHAIAEFGAARIGEGEVGHHGRRAAPGGQHAELIGEVIHRYLGAQFVEAELGGQRRSQRLRAVQQEAAAVPGGRFGDEEIRNDLALRCQQGSKARCSRLDGRKLRRHQIVEEMACVVAVDLDDATIGEKRCFHLAAGLGSAKGT